MILAILAVRKIFCKANLSQDLKVKLREERGRRRKRDYVFTEKIFKRALKKNLAAFKHLAKARGTEITEETTEV